MTSSWYYRSRLIWVDRKDLSYSYQVSYLVLCVMKVRFEKESLIPGFPDQVDHTLIVCGTIQITNIFFYDLNMINLESYMVQSMVSLEPKTFMVQSIINLFLYGGNPGFEEQLHNLKKCFGLFQRSNTDDEETRLC